MRQPRPHLLLALVLLAAPAAAGVDPTEPRAFKFYVSDAGVYRVTFEDLETAGLSGPVGSAGLGVRRSPVGIGGPAFSK